MGSNPASEARQPPASIAKFARFGAAERMARHIPSHMRETSNGSRRLRRLVPWRHASCRKTEREEVMKTILSTLVALSVLAGVAAVAYAATDAKQFFEQQERWSGGGQ
jgi:hypothetical protein